MTTLAATPVVVGVCNRIFKTRGRSKKDKRIRLVAELDGVQMLVGEAEQICSLR